MSRQRETVRHQTQARSFIGEDPCHPGPAPDFLADTFKHVDSSDAPVVADRESKNSQPFRHIQFQPISQFGVFGLILLDHLVEPILGSGQVWRMEDIAQFLSHFALQGFTRYVCLDILLQMVLATLPRNTTKNRVSGCLQACMGIADDELHTSQASLHQALQEGTPVDFLLAERYGKP